MKKLFAIGLLALCSATFAQTEADLLRWAEENKPLADSGTLSQLEFHRELYRRISIIPAESYPHKLTNMRWIGRKIDILEALEAGQLTVEQVSRRLAEADAEAETDDVNARKARSAAEAQRQEVIRQRQAQAEAEEDARRRALAGQIMLKRMGQPAPTYQVPLYQKPVPQARPQTTCTTARVGNQLETKCQ